MPANYNIAQTLHQRAHEQPYQQAIIYPCGKSQGRTSYTQLNYRQLEKRSHLIAMTLMREGVKPGQKVVLMVPPSLDFFALTFALFHLGAIPVFIDPGLGIRGIGSSLEGIRPQAFIGIRKAHLARQLFSWNKGRWEQLVVTDGFWPGCAYLQKKMKAADQTTHLVPLHHCDEKDPAAILFTSGSTGRPKGALYTHQNFRAQIALLKRTYDIQPGELDLCTFPLFALFAPALGMTAVIPDMNFTKPGQVNPDKIFEAIDNFGIQNMFGSPALIKRVASAGQLTKRQLPSLKRVISAGAPVPAETLQQLSLLTAASCEIHTPYGATEALPVSSIESREILGETSARSKKGHGVCIGRIAGSSTGSLGVDVKIIKITDTPMERWHDSLLEEPGQIGEICVKGPQVTRSYYENHAATQLAKIMVSNTGDFYHRMGDLGYFDEQGRLWFCGRKAHRVITDKKTYYTVSCESIFNQHPLVFRTALVGSTINHHVVPTLCIELHPEHQRLARKDKENLITELRQLAQKHTQTAGIDRFVFHKSFPVDIRHNSKIFREKLAIWAQELPT